MAPATCSTRLCSTELVAEKLETIRADISGEGWRWVEAVSDLDWDDLRKFARRYPERVKLPKKLQKEHDRLSGEYDELVDTNDESSAGRLEQIELRMAELTSLAQQWPAETLALAGAIISIDHDGSVTIERGLVRKEDLRQAKTTDQDASGDNAHPTAQTGVSTRLVQDLTAQKSAAVGAELMSQPDVALAAVVHCLALPVWYAGSDKDSCLELLRGPFSLRSSLTDPDDCHPFGAVEQERERMGDWLPGTC